MMFNYYREDHRSLTKKIPYKKILGLSLIIIPYLLFYILPIDCWFFHPKPIPSTTSCTYGEVIGICSNQAIMGSIFGAGLAGSCGYFTNIQYGVWIVMGLGLLALVGII
jgi:hypothetical protein